MSAVRGVISELVERRLWPLAVLLVAAAISRVVRWPSAGPKRTSSTVVGPDDVGGGVPVDTPLEPPPPVPPAPEVVPPPLEVEPPEGVAGPSWFAAPVVLAVALGTCC